MGQESVFGISGVTHVEHVLDLFVSSFFLAVLYIVMLWYLSLIPVLAGLVAAIFRRKIIYLFYGITTTFVVAFGAALLFFLQLKH